MCLNCKPLIKAIDRYIAKADEKLVNMFEEEGRAEPEKTVEYMSEIEEETAAALVSETEYFISEIEKCDSLEQAEENFEKIKDNDSCLEKLKPFFKEKLGALVALSAKGYIKQMDRELTISRLSKRTVARVNDWSEELGNIMRLNSHKEIEDILVKGLKDGDGVDVFTRKILDSGIRNEYYKARRVAVTEVLRAHSVAFQESIMQNPAVEYKRWMHTGAHKNMPRQNHIDMDGQTVPKGARFKLTGANGKTYSPMYPLDSILPPEESINCHCAVQETASEKILGMPLEERKKLQQKALDEMDDDWEKELNAKNRADWEKRHKAAKDKKEFEEYSKILGKKNMPKNLDEFQNLKYNDIEGWDKLKLNYSDEKLRIKLKGNETSKTIALGSQGKHIKGHNNYIKGRSYLTISEEEAQELVNKYAGTGEILRTAKGEWRHQEKIKSNKIVGVDVNDITGEETSTTWFKIHYSKKGTHIVPYKGDY